MAKTKEEPLILESSLRFLLAKKLHPTDKIQKVYINSAYLPKDISDKGVLKSINHVYLWLECLWTCV